MGLSHEGGHAAAWAAPGQWPLSPSAAAPSAGDGTDDHGRGFEGGEHNR